MKVNILKKLRNKARKRFVLQTRRTNGRFNVYRIYDNKHKRTMNTYGMRFYYIERDLEEYRREYIELLLGKYKRKWKTLKA